MGENAKVRAGRPSLNYPVFDGAKTSPLKWRLEMYSL